MPAKLRELSTWYVDPRSDEHTYNVAHVAAHGWDSPRTGVYLTTRPNKEGYVRVTPGLNIKKAKPDDDVADLRAAGYDGVRYLERDGSDLMLLFDYRNIHRPMGPKKKAPKGR